MAELSSEGYEDNISGYWELNIPTKSFDFDNSLRTLLGYEPAEISSNVITWRKLLAAKLSTKLRDRYNRHVDSQQKVPFVIELGLYHKDKSIHNILFTGKVIERDQDNNPLRMVGSYLDVTAKKRAEKELQQVKEFLNKTNHTALVGGWELDLETNEVIWTKITRDIFEVPDDFTLNRATAFNFFKQGSDRNKLTKSFTLAVTKGIPYDLELKIVTAKGHELWTRNVGHPEFVDGKCVRIYGVLQNINDHKLNEEALLEKQQQLQKMAKAKMEFLSVMSHEIRTPMNAVIGFTNLLLQNPRKDQLDNLNILKFSAENLLTLINDILDYNKIDGEKFDFEKIDFSLISLIENIKASQHQEADKKDLGLELQIDPRLPQMIIGDPLRLGQVITNLVANAIKFTHQGKVQIILKVIEQDVKRVKIHFEVTDTGIGIAKDKLDYIFEKFSQASSDTTRKYGGTGLGLAISKRLLEIARSKIHVTSKLGEGSSFYFEVAFKKSEKQDIKVPAPLFYDGRLDGKRILIAEDNAINVMVVKKFLVQWGVECDVAQNGKIACAKVAANDYDLVLMDIQMPEMDGYEATKAIRKMPDVKYKDLPIIALTASVLDEVKDQIRLSGIDGYLTKPFKPIDLYDVLSHYLRQNSILSQNA